MTKARKQDEKGTDEGAKNSRLSVALTPEAKRAVNRICDRYSMVKQNMVSRAMLWLETAPEPLQHCVLGIAAPQMTEEYQRQAAAYFGQSAVHPRIEPSKNEPVMDEDDGANESG